MPETTIFEAALIATVLSVFYPVLLIFLLVFYALYFGLPFAWLSLVFAIVGGIGGLVLFKRLFPKVEGAKLTKKGDFEKIASMFGLLFGLGGALFTLGSFYDRTVTHTSCATPPTVNVTSPNCKVIETVSIPQLGGYGNFGSLVLLITVVSMAVFAVWVAVLYSLSKAGL